MENKKMKGPREVPSRWKITPLKPAPDGQSMMLIEDNQKKMPTMAISHKDAMKKFAIETVNTQIGSGTYPMPHPKYTEEQLDLANQVNGYLVSVNTPDSVKAVKRGRPATGRKNYDHAAYQKAYRDRQRQKKIDAANAAKKGI